MKKFIKDNYVFIGDSLAIPFFMLMIYYFNKKKNKTIIENIIYILYIFALIIDSIFILLRFKNNLNLIQLKKFVFIIDFLAIPFSSFVLYYFYKIKNKTLLEKILLIFVFYCLIADILFTFLYYKNE